MNYTRWYEENYPALSGRGIWLRGDELHRLDPEEFERRPFRLLIARLSTYRDTAASFTHRLLYRIAAQQDGIFPDLAYLPPPRDAAEFEKGDIPWLLGTASKCGPRAFDCIAVTNATIQELINLPTMLTRSGISLTKSVRMADPAQPLVILGGANAAATPLLWAADSLVDGIYIGGDTTAIAELFTVCREGKRQGLTKQKILESLETIPGFFQPEKLTQTPVKVNDGQAVLTQLERIPLPFGADQLGSGHLPISEGCPGTCGFCLESWMHKPYREAPIAELVSRVRRMKAQSGLDSIEIFSFNFNMHRDIYRLLWELSELFPAIGLKSQRFDLLARTPAMLQFLHAVGKSSLTCGMEGISARQRRYLHKGLSESDLRASLAFILNAPIRELKVFLIATGLEEEEDFEEFGELLEFMRLCLEKNGRSPRIVFSLTPLTRFPCTPLENEDAPSRVQLQTIISRIGNLCRGRGWEFRQACSADEYWVNQVLARASDPRILPALLEAVAQTGFVYYREIEPAFAELLAEKLSTRGIGSDELLTGFVPKAQRPWDGIEIGTGRAALQRILQHCREYRQPLPATPQLQPRTTATGSLPQTMPAGLTGQHLRERIKRNAATERPLRLTVTLKPRLAGLPRAMAGVVLSRGLMLSDEKLTAGYRGFRGSAWNLGEGSEWICGDDVLTFAWREAELAHLLPQLADPAFIANVNSLCGDWLTLHGLAPAAPAASQLLFESPFAFTEQEYLAKNNLRHTRRKIGDASYRFEFVKDALKRQILSNLTVSRDTEGRWEVRIVPGKRFTLHEFCQEAFDLPTVDEWVRIRIVGSHGSC
jgi:radical SAM superfamily enzyme YgiQ (UPF0313 family)